ncbi:nuclear receptor 2C2-associated protein [Strongylocentrotus purpuratus]|uniref:Nuclear receptor 2C2-associated protein n=1 Tax=Strongylocentrotus purpuratus TaxID=7668 RepID=A0A7M7NB25_STRPU|nr:nuclear receptor 2C2-associated protein [Strongylocentrotus purpuratus]
MAASIVQSAVGTRVSSVLNRDVKQFGKKFLFDNNEETCWNSDQGTPQWASIELQEPHQCTELHLQFQGGFASKTCWVEGSLPGERPKKLMDFYPQDDNTLQIFQFPPGCSASSYLKIVFAESTDFFGRITLYKLDILGIPS